jgi:7,8-dihydropterin-6-yl-methyl-4-(beta-D-ribofuranosyl)aminobenzene 5'-phosphate synthase
VANTPASTPTDALITYTPASLPTDAPQPTTTPLPTAGARRGDDELRITILYDNTAYDPRLKAEWGFAALIEVGEETLLFDTGGDAPTLLGNMELLGIDPTSIETVVLSHIHGDHTGGLGALDQAGARPTVYVLPSFPDDFKGQLGVKAQVVEVEPGQQVAEAMYTTGEIAGVPVPEQALVIKTEDGLVIVTGCAHPGIVQMVRRAKEQFGGPIRLVVGGFHLLNKSDTAVNRVLSDLRGLGVEQVAPTHCTGERAIAMFAEEYGADYIEAGVGRVIVLESVATGAPAAPYALISQESLFGFLEDLTAIQPYSGWRNSASEGEAEALDYVAATLGNLPHLRSLGLELERQSFPVFLGTDLWETRLHLIVDGEEIEVPADGLRGPRDDIVQALRFDSDGSLNDVERDPVVVEGPVQVVRSASDIQALDQADIRGTLVFLDYAVVDRVLLGMEEAVRTAYGLLSKDPAGVVLVTQFSNQPGESHGFAVGDLSALNWVETETAPPVLYVRMEDLTPAGIADWDDLAQVETARLTWDADVLSPAESGNLVARVPGKDPSQAMILGAHIDSPNSPGAMDDGSGSAVLLEVARVLDAASIQPPVDLYLVWFGGEELGLYGSSHFLLTHQELLDRTLAMLQIDCLTRPLDGIDADLNLVTWSYGRLGDDPLSWPSYLVQAAAGRDVRLTTEDFPVPYSDNTAFSGFDVPNADLIYVNEQAMEDAGGFHYAGHVHDPYDTVTLAREVGDVLEQMAQVALIAALETGYDNPALHVAPRPVGRVLFVGSHTESVHMAPTTFIELAMALAWEGFDVDVIPFGQPLRAADVDADALDMVVVLPVVDYPSPEGDPNSYDESWSQDEAAALEEYVNAGGLLVLTNSAHRLKYGNRVLDLNEDWSDANALAERFGVSYQEGDLRGDQGSTEGDHMLVDGVEVLEMAEANGVPFTMEEGLVLARAGGAPIAGLVDYGNAEGQVLVLADVGILGAGWGEPVNLPFWKNLARYAASR